MFRPLPLRTSFLSRLDEFNGRLRGARPVNGCALAVLVGAASLFAAPSAQAGDCPADFNGDGNVDAGDLLELLSNLGACDDPEDCPWDFNDDDMVDEVDLAYLLESWGPCPSAVPGELELFDQVVAVDATNAEAQALGLIVTHVYATGDNVTEGDALLIVDDANIDATGDTTFFQSSLGGDTPPDPEDVQSDPPLAYDTFVAVNLLTDDDGASEDDVSLTEDFTMTDTTIDGGWFALYPQTQREAVDISEATGESAQFGVLISQTSLEVPCESPPTGYAGTLRLYTSTHEGGSLQGVQAEVQFSVCPADLNGSGDVAQDDLIILIGTWGPCPGCAADFNYDDVVDNIDLVYLLESWGACPSAVPVDLELFDEVVTVDVTDAKALALGLIVTHVYATGDNVAEGDALLIVDEANIDATDDTTFFQHRLGSDTPPDPDDVQSNPPLEYDTFVAVNMLTDDDDTFEDDVSLTDRFTMTDTTIDGGWYATSAQREASDDGVLIAQITLQIDPGESTLGYTGMVRLYTSTHDCGALQGVEAQFQFSINLCSADFDGDGTVGASDLAQLLGAWGPNPGHPADFDGDGDVDAADLALLLGSWGACE